MNDPPLGEGTAKLVLAAGRRKVPAARAYAADGAGGDQVGERVYTPGVVRCADARTPVA